MNSALILDKTAVWRRLGIISLLLILLVGPNFGPIPLALHEVLSLEGAVIGMLVWFWLAFSLIIFAIMRLKGERSLGQFLRSTGLGAPSRTGANIAGVIVGLLWGALLLTSIFQFDPDANIAQFNGFRVLAVLLAGTGVVLEDIITRGFLMNELKQLHVPNWAQALISALIFALYHTVVAGFNIFAFIFSVVYGLLLAGLFLWGKRSLTPVILGHSLAVIIAEPFASMLIFLSANL